MKKNLCFSDALAICNCGHYQAMPGLSTETDMCNNCAFSIKTPIYKFQRMDYFTAYLSLQYFESTIYWLIFNRKKVCGDIFLVFQHFRLYSIPPIGTLVDKQFRQFLDEKDKGRLIVSHLYLLLGSSLPLWLSDLHNGKFNCEVTLTLWLLKRIKDILPAVKQVSC